MDRLGNTSFYLADMEYEMDPDVIFPVSEINAVRRDLTESMENKLLEGLRRDLPENADERVSVFLSAVERKAEKEQELPHSLALAVAVSDPPGVRAALDGGAHIVYFGGVSMQGREPWTKESLAAGVDLCHRKKAQAWLVIPRIWPEHESNFVENILQQAGDLGADGVLAGDLGGLQLAVQAGLTVGTDFSVPVFNDPAAMLLLDRGLSRVTLSPELNREQLANLRLHGSPRLEMLVHGALPLMISEHCVIGAVTGQDGQCNHACSSKECYLRDRKGYIFPIHSDKHCRMTLYNARDLCLIEQLDEILGSGQSAVRLELRAAQAEQVRRITDIYRRNCQLYLTGGWDQTSGKRAWDDLLAVAAQGMTRGHYLRGIINEADIPEREA